MNFTWREHDEARDDLHGAARWYAGIVDDLGERFLQAIEIAAESILDPTYRWGFYADRKSEPQIYARNVSGFPFQIIYVLNGDEVLVLAYAHERRQPKYWVHRLGN